MPALFPVTDSFDSFVSAKRRVTSGCSSIPLLRAADVVSTSCLLFFMNLNGIARACHWQFSNFLVMFMVSRLLSLALACSCLFVSLGSAGLFVRATGGQGIFPLLLGVESWMILFHRCRAGISTSEKHLQICQEWVQTHFWTFLDVKCSNGLISNSGSLSIGSTGHWPDETNCSSCRRQKARCRVHETWSTGMVDWLPPVMKLGACCKITMNTIGKSSINGAFFHSYRNCASLNRGWLLLLDDFSEGMRLTGSEDIQRHVSQTEYPLTDWCETLLNAVSGGMLQYGMIHRLSVRTLSLAIIPIPDCTFGSKRVRICETNVEHDGRAFELLIMGNARPPHWRMIVTPKKNIQHNPMISNDLQQSSIFSVATMRIRRRRLQVGDWGDHPVSVLGIEKTPTWALQDDLRPWGPKNAIFFYTTSWKDLNEVVKRYVWKAFIMIQSVHWGVEKDSHARLQVLLAAVIHPRHRGLVQAKSVFECLRPGTGRSQQFWLPQVVSSKSLNISVARAAQDYLHELQAQASS